VAAGAVAAGAACLWLVDPTRGSVGLPCPFRAVTGLDCPLCGATRATWALLHAEPARALGYNALWVAFVPLVLWAWALDVRGGFDRSGHPFRRRAFWTATVAVAAVFAVVRNLPWDPWRALGT
jgi:hypothetical protein